MPLFHLLNSIAENQKVRGMQSLGWATGWPLDSASRRRRTKANEEVTCGSRKLEPITPLLKGEGFHALLLLIRSGPHGVLDTFA